MEESEKKKKKKKRGATSAIYKSKRAWMFLFFPSVFTSYVCRTLYLLFSKLS
jgi:hypothetical protein